MSPGGDRQSAELRSRYEALLDRVRNPARLIGGEPGAGPGFPASPDSLRVVLGFPDAYEIGIANQALQILYHLATVEPGVAVERVYLPWVDVIAELREERLPLLTLESWTPVRDAHLLGLSLQHELNFTNVLELLDLAGIPLRRGERGEADPLVIGGGPATANFLPVAGFFDALVVGDAEEAFPEVLRALADGVRSGASRPARLEALAALEGVFVPNRSQTVRRRVVADLSRAPYPDACIVPLTEGVHDRGWVEVARGCTRGCRFCQAGMWYRPVRERPAEEVLERAGRLLDASGYQELSLASLSTTDYSGLTPVLGALARTRPETRINLPSLRVDSAAVRLGRMTSPSGGSITLAPEAGSQRMRDVINKNVSEEDVLDAVGEAYGLGYTTVKLYFMIGLPTERDEDVEAIADLVGRVRRLGEERLGSAKGRLQVHVSVTNFIPKPMTPFQWEPMADRETLERRQGILAQRLRGRRLKLSLHDVDDSYLEAALARGGVELGEVIRDAWRRGARFDSWTEQRRPEAWLEAFAATGRSAEERSTARLDREASLPWEVVTGGVERAFLLRERRRAFEGRTTVDCRTGACADCGVCRGAVDVRLAAAESSAPGEGAPGGGREEAPAGSDRAPEDAVEFVHALLTFQARGRARYLGHLDTAEALRRAVRRAGGRLALSAGLRPKPLLALALPRAVGVEGRSELCEFSLFEEPPPDFAGRLDEALPAGFSVVSLEYAQERFKAAARVRGASYRVALAEGRAGVAVLLREAASRYTEAESIRTVRERKGRRQEVDVRRYVDSVEVVEDDPGPFLRFTAEVTPQGTVRPEEVVTALADIAGVDVRIVSIERTEILLEQ